MEEVEYIDHGFTRYKVITTYDENKRVIGVRLVWATVELEDFKPDDNKYYIVNP